MSTSTYTSGRDRGAITSDRTSRDESRLRIRYLITSLVVFPPSGLPELISVQIRGSYVMYIMYFMCKHVLCTSGYRMCNTLERGFIRKSATVHMHTQCDSSYRLKVRLCVSSEKGPRS